MCTFVALGRSKWTRSGESISSERIGKWTAMIQERRFPPTDVDGRGAVRMSKSRVGNLAERHASWRMAKNRIHESYAIRNLAARPSYSHGCTICRGPSGKDGVRRDSLNCIGGLSGRRQAVVVWEVVVVVRLRFIPRGKRLMYNTTTCRQRTCHQGTGVKTMIAMSSR